MQNIPEWHREGLAEVKSSLSPLEKQLAESLKMIKVMGKRGRTVPILIPAECQVILNKLADEHSRLSAGIEANNRYLFANAGNQMPL